jgi:hypothetical protein
MGWPDEQKVDHDAEVKAQADIAANVPSDEAKVEAAPVVAGETADQPDAAADEDAPVSIVLAADATGPDAEGNEVPLNEVSIAGVVLVPGEPVEVPASVARSLVYSEDNVEVAE